MSRAFLLSLLTPPTIYGIIGTRRIMKKTHEEKIADRLAGIVKDSTLDLETVGQYLGRMVPSYLLQRVMIVAEAGQHEREMQDLRSSNSPLF